MEIGQVVFFAFGVQDTTNQEDWRISFPRSQAGPMHGRKQQLEKKLQDLLNQASQVATELDRLERPPGEVPRYLHIELNAHQVGRRLSCAIQQTQLAELTCEQPEHAGCPDCGTRCRIHSARRKVQSMDGPLQQLEPKAHCPSCRRDFFPSA